MCLNKIIEKFQIIQLRCIFGGIDWERIFAGVNTVNKRTDKNSLKIALKNLKNMFQISSLKSRIPVTFGCYQPTNKRMVLAFLNKILISL